MFWGVSSIWVSMGALRDQAEVHPQIFRSVLHCTSICSPCNHPEGLHLDLGSSLGELRGYTMRGPGAANSVKLDMWGYAEEG